MFANVVVDINAPGLPQAFTYRVPEHLENEVFEGACVAVPFHGRELIGYVLELIQEAPDIHNIKDLSFVVQDTSALKPPLLKLARWMAEYYAAPLPDCIRAILPGVMSATVTPRVRLIDANQTSSSSPDQQHLVRLLAKMQGEADMNVLAAKSGIPRFSAVLRALRKRGAIEIIHTISRPKARPLTVQAVQIAEGVEHPDLDKLAIRAPKQAAIMKVLLHSSKPIPQSEILRRLGASSASIQALVDRGFMKKVDVQVHRGTSKTAHLQESTPLALTIDQENALRTVLTETNGQPATVLLHGVTGSGKTEVYLQCIDEILRRGSTCLVLVPEIALTVHLIDAYTSRFENQLAVLHSRLSVGERYDEWRRIENGEAPIVLGARSAVFAPLHNLGLVVIDEE
ncbi:MAG: DEAD/DEAH box helicase, partial [Armatimonadota bacterium]